MNDELPPPPGLWQRFCHWLAGLHLRVVTLQDTPHSIALGLAIGVFFGFTPLWSLKTLLSIGVAWLLGGNKIAAAISVQVHDLILPFMPAIYLWEYKLGYWAMHGHLPRRIGFHLLALREYVHWEMFFTVGRPLLLGSFIIGLPSAAAAYFICRTLISRHRAKRASR
ncbi:MAG TPA: DUF2062 domain-containing protein [Chthoniobacterales bacterium]|nr:DUF2062 domain-containing protein [Chthoniobacterales bacterium]